MKWRSPIPLWACIVTILVVIAVTDRNTDSFIVELAIAATTGLALGPNPAVIARIAAARRARRTS